MITIEKIEELVSGEMDEEAAQRRYERWALLMGVSSKELMLFLVRKALSRLRLGGGDRGSSLIFGKSWYCL
jgi:hypothetical protein